MSVETATSVVSETISSSVEAVSSQTFSSIPAPEIPSSIIAEIPRPAGLESLDSPPAPLTGSFDLKDIIAQPFKQSAGDTRIEPAVFLNPKIVEEIYAPKSLTNDTNTEQEQAPLVQEPYLRPVLTIEPESQHDQEKQTLTLSQAEQEFGKFTAELLTLGSVQITEEETRADQEALVQAYALLQSQDFSEEEVQSWKKKLAQAAKVQLDHGSIKIDESTATSTVKATAPAAITDGEPPKTPTAVGTIGENEQPQEKEEKEEPEQEVWDVYHIGKRWQNAKETNKARQKVANEIATEAAQTDKNPRLAAEKSTYKLDVPSLDEAIRIATEDLNRPAIAHKIYTALTFVDEDDSQAVQNTVLKTVAENTSQEKKRYVAKKEAVEPKDLPEEAQKLIADGDKHLIYKKGQWKPVKKLKLRELVEAEKAA